MDFRLDPAAHRRRAESKELARRLGLKRQRILRYDATDYASAKLSRLQAVMHALGVEVRMESVRSAADR